MSVGICIELGGSRRRENIAVTPGNTADCQPKWSTHCHLSQEKKTTTTKNNNNNKNL
jgi:hypothetical protein